MWGYYNKFDSAKSLGYVTDVSKYHNAGIWSMDYNMTVWILAGNYIIFTIAAGLIRLHMPGVKKYRV